MDFNELLVASKTKKLDDSTKSFLKNPFKNIPSLNEALQFCKKYNIDLHPRYLYYWSELSLSELVNFLEFLKKVRFVLAKNGDLESLEFPFNEEKIIFENLGIEHKLRVLSLAEVKSEEEVNLMCLDKLNSQMLLINLGFPLILLFFALVLLICLWLRIEQNYKLLLWILYSPLRLLHNFFHQVIL